VDRNTDVTQLKVLLDLLLEKLLEVERKIDPHTLQDDLKNKSQRDYFLGLSCRYSKTSQQCQMLYLAKNVYLKSYSSIPNKTKLTH
jgi:hypothetical protein